MTSIGSVTLEVADPAAAERFYTTALGLGNQVRLRASQAPTTGFRGFTLSLTVSQPANASRLIDAALDAGATALKPAAKSFWGYGGVVQAPDGTIWKVATSAKKDTGPATRQIDQLVLLLGVADVAASKRFYVDRGLTLAKSFGRKYVEFASASSPVKLALYGRRALAKDAGVPPEGTGSHRIIIGSDAGTCTDPDGFAWEAASLRAGWRGTVARQPSHGITAVHHRAKPREPFNGLARKESSMKDMQKPSSSTADRASKGFTDEERAAMRERARELKAPGRRGPRAGKAHGESDVLEKIAERGPRLPPGPPWPAVALLTTHRRQLARPEARRASRDERSRSKEYVGNPF